VIGDLEIVQVPSIGLDCRCCNIIQM
jgi:hypothetical protein